MELGGRGNESEMGTCPEHNHLQTEHSSILINIMDFRESLIFVKIHNEEKVLLELLLLFQK